MPYIHSTFGCFEDVNQCLDTWFCFPCQAGRQCNAIDGVVDQHNCAMCCVAMCFPTCTAISLRCRVSDKYQLEESPIVSCLLGWFCGPCSVCMTGRELNERGANPGGFCCSPASRSTGNSGQGMMY